MNQDPNDEDLSLLDDEDLLRALERDYKLHGKEPNELELQKGWNRLRPFASTRKRRPIVWMLGAAAAILLVGLSTQILNSLRPSETLQFRGDKTQEEVLSLRVEAEDGKLRFSLVDVKKGESSVAALWIHGKGMWRKVWEGKKADWPVAGLILSRSEFLEQACWLEAASEGELSNQIRILQSVESSDASLCVQIP